MMMAASKRKLRRQQCQGKVQFSDYGPALAEAERRHLIVYKCPFCGNYHLGHQQARTKQIMREKGKW